MTEKELNIKVQETPLLIPQGSSKRLATLAKENWPAGSGIQKLNDVDDLSFLDLPEDILDLLKEARNQIDQQIEWLSKSYPPGKQKKFFSIKYGDVERLKQKSIKQIFAALDIVVKPQNFNLIAGLNYFGHQT